MGRKLVVVGTVVVAALALVAFWLLTIPETVPASALAPHTPDLGNGKTMFFAGGCASCHASRPNKKTRRRLGGGLGLGRRSARSMPQYLARSRPTASGNGPRRNFVTAMVKGTSPTGEHLFPAFPYTSYQRMKFRGHSRPVRLSENACRRYRARSSAHDACRFRSISAVRSASGSSFSSMAGLSHRNPLKTARPGSAAPT